MSAVIDFLEEKGIYYKFSGQDVLIKCLNPDHDDGSPSMRIDKVLGVFNCFSCGFKGSLFKHYDVDYSELEIRREKMRRTLSSLRSSGVGLPMPEGFSPYIGNWRNIKAETYAEFEAFRHHDAKFQGRIVFPIKDASGRIVCFQGRDEMGTLNSKYMFHPANAKLPLFPQVRPLQGRVILVEGIFDMLNLHDKGLTNSICCFGVKNFNENKLNYLKVSGATGLDVIFDPDEAGIAGAAHVKTIALDFPVRTIKLRSGDPGSLTQQQVTGLRSKLYG